MGYYTALVDCTVEHIYAQNCELGPKDDWHIHCLGNCTLLGQKLNSSVGKKAPVKKFKIPAYAQSGFQPTIDLTSLSQWEDSDIEEKFVLVDYAEIKKISTVDLYNKKHVWHVSNNSTGIYIKVALSELKTAKVLKLSTT